MGISVDPSSLESAITDIQMMDNGAYVDTITIAGKTITGRQMRETVLGFKIKSAAFDISFSGDNVVFTTHGYGHGAGMSQWGAHYYAVKEGWSYSQILSHYYQGTTLSTR